MADKKNMKVVIRVRPFNRTELEQNQRNIIKVLDGETLVFDPDEDDDEFFYQGTKQNFRDVTKRVKKKLTMEYDVIHDTHATNSEIFESCTKNLVNEWLMSGFNCSVFVYGATGAGKTYTMLGNAENPGLTFLTMRELFNAIEANSDNQKFDIGISYLEVYNEQVMNLLDRNVGPLKLREDSSGVVVGGLVLKQIHSAEELLELLHMGNRNRTQHPTDANAESSRSHAVFQVHIRMTDKRTSQKRMVKLSMIDLAGSERAAANIARGKGASLGLRFKEGANINKSLLSLGNCINKLADGMKHIPYRDSNLTRILKDSLGGNCRTVMIANISPSSLTYDDTYNTLKYASRAKKIRVQLTKNVVSTNVPKEYLIKKVNDQNCENERLKERIRVLEERLALAESTAKLAHGTNGRMEVDQKAAVDLSAWHTKIDLIYCSLKKAQEQYLAMQAKENLLNIRTKFKEHAERLTKALSLDGSHVAGDIARLEASIDNYDKQVQRQKDDMSRWAQRYRESSEALVGLLQEIQNAGLTTSLDLYLKGKNLELELLKSEKKRDLATEMTRYYNVEWEQAHTSSLLSAAILNENYLLMRHSGLVDPSLMEKLEKLIKVNRGQRAGIKFSQAGDEEEEEDKGIEAAAKRLKVTKPVKKTNEVKPKPKAVVKSFNFQPEALKRPPLPQQYNEFKVPKPVMSAKPAPALNETQTLSVSDDLEGISSLNATFQVPAQPTNHLSEVLVENGQKSGAINKVMARSTQKGFVMPKVRSTLHKENKKLFTPNRVKKSSPRRMSLKTSATRFRTVPTTPNGRRKSTVKLVRIKK